MSDSRFGSPSSALVQMSVRPETAVAMAHSCLSDDCPVEKEAAELLVEDFFSVKEQHRAQGRARVSELFDSLFGSPSGRPDDRNGSPASRPAPDGTAQSGFGGLFERYGSMFGGLDDGGRRSMNPRSGLHSQAPNQSMADRGSFMPPPDEQSRSTNFGNPSAAADQGREGLGDVPDDLGSRLSALFKEEKGGQSKPVSRSSSRGSVAPNDTTASTARQ